MAVAFEKTQVDIQPSSFHHSTPTAGLPIAHTQLQFNPNEKNVPKYPIIKKPRPIIIEKLMPSGNNNVATPINNNTEYLVGVHSQYENALSSEKLAMAVQLAKMDIKKLKNMLTNDNVVEVETKTTSDKVKVKKDRNKQLKPVKEKRSTTSDEQRPMYQVEVYPRQQSKRDITSYEPLINHRQKHTGQLQGCKQEMEVAMLQNNILNHSQQLNNLIKSLQNNDHISGRTQDRNPEEHKRNLQKAEQQKSRSTRILYNLHHKVQQLDRKDKLQIKHTKKSVYAESLASAQRAAIRTLQTFLSHAPLFFDTSGKLPSSYQELATLLQRLTKLTTEDLPSSGDLKGESVIQELLKATQKSSMPEETKMKSQLKWNLKDEKNKILKKALEEKADELGMKSFHKDSEASPERISTIQHAIEVLHEEQRIKRSPKKMKHNPKKKSVLVQRKSRVSKDKYENIKSDFSAPTVLSRIRKKPPIEKPPKVITPPSSPKRKLQFNGVSPKKIMDEELIKLARSKDIPNIDTKTQKSAKLASPPPLLSSPRRPSPDDSVRTSPLLYYNSPRSSPSPISGSNGFPNMQRELERQHWLDRYKMNEFRKLEKMNKITSKEFRKLKSEYSSTNALIQHAENEIKEKLKPLIVKAEEIASEEARRAIEYSQSVKRRLADVASHKAMSEGERLAEYILDDLIRDAAVDLQIMEDENECELEAAFQCDRPTLESINDKIEQFEQEEADMRRYYQSLPYIDVRNASTHVESHQHRQQTYDSPSIRQGPFTVFTNLSNRNQIETPERDKQVTINKGDTFNIPTAFINNIFLFKERYENYLNKVKYTSSGFDPFQLVEQLSEELVDGMITTVSKEVHDICGDCVDNLYEREFLTEMRAEKPR